MNNDINQNENKPKWTKGRIIKIVIYSLVLALVILLLVVSCKKNKVNALSSSDSFFTDNVSLTNLSTNDYIIYYFNVFDTRLLYGNSYPLLVIDNYNSLYVAFTYFGTYIDVGSNAFNGIRLYNMNDIQGIALFFYKAGSVVACDIVSYYYDNSLSYNYSSQVLGTYTFTSSQTSIDVELYSKLWQNGLFYHSPNNNINFSEMIYNTLSTNYVFQTTEYQNDHIFGNVVSSFLNIQFGRATIGNTTIDFTLGTLLLFILGLGALFIIIKVFLGG